MKDTINFLEPTYCAPMTNKQFIGMYNFNNPKVEDYWESEAKSYTHELESKLEMSEFQKTYGDSKIKICYL